MDANLTDDEDGDNSSIEKELFPLTLEDKVIVDEAVGVVKDVLRRASLSGRDVHRIGKLLFALERLPRSTSGISIGMTVSHRANDEMTYRDIFISESVFWMNTGGSVYTPGVGSDSYSSTVFHVETGGYRAGTDFYEVSTWADSFRELLNMTRKVEFEDLDEDAGQIDWDDEGSETYWDEITEGEQS